MIAKMSRQIRESLIGLKSNEKAVPAEKFSDFLQNLHPDALKTERWRTKNEQGNGC